MAIQTAGQKPAKDIKLKIENLASFDLPKDTEKLVHDILGFLPLEHQRGLAKIKLVDFINDPRLKNLDKPIGGDMPGLYHPKVNNQSAFLEVSMGAILQPTEGFAKKMMAKSAFKGNLAGILFSLIGQHYYFTLRHSVNKQNLEPQIRQYAEKNLKAWSETQQVNNWRTKLLKPFRPYLEKMAKWLNKKAVEAQKK